MKDSRTETPQHRATILVGYGDFGRDLFRRFLASTALRGVLAWEEPHEAEEPGERRLRDLALLWLGDRLAGGPKLDGEESREGGGLEILKDVYRQIESVAGDGPTDTSFADALAAIAERLLSASTRAARGAMMPLGLDVILLAQPSTPEVVGHLDRLMTRGADRLANNANLNRAVQGAEALNFLSILDFENYWDRGEAGKRVREAVHGSVEQWRRRRDTGKPGFGRFFLVDGRTDDGIREPTHRLDEICLFLELLLFEGQRGGDLQRLYQSQAAVESPVATFGIRLLERSSGLLARLAAAHFGIGWLAYLTEAGPSSAASEPRALIEELEAYSPDRLDLLVDKSHLIALVETNLAELEGELAALPGDHPDWRNQVRSLYERAVGRLEARLTETVRARMAEVRTTRLDRCGERLRAAVGEVLHDSRRPVTLGTALGQVEHVLALLDATRDLPVPHEPKGDSFASLAELDSQRHRFAAEKLRPEGLRRWWFPLSATLAAGLAPLATDLLTELPRPDPSRRWPTLLYDGLQHFATPHIIIPVLLFGLWAGGALAFQRVIARRLEREDLVFSDPDQGRLIDRVRAALNPGGALRIAVDRLLDRLVDDMLQSVRGEVSRELDRTAELLRERRREMLWLRGQLRDLLHLYGLSSEVRELDLSRPLREGTGLRRSMERGEDLDRILKANPPGPERFRSTQATNPPFAGWDRRYGEAFLYPLAFLDRLSLLYTDPAARELTRPDQGPESQRQAQELSTFVERDGAFGLAFRWARQDGVPPDRRYTLLPSAWRALPGVLTALSRRGITEESVLVGTNDSRAYLLRLQTGVEPSCLLDLP